MAAPIPPSARAAARAIAAGTLTVEALARACLDRIAERDPLLRAWAHVDPERALAEARRLDAMERRGPLHGVPVAVKDVIDVAGLPTGHGSPIHAAARPAVADAACVAAARAAGLLVLGKTVTTEFATYTPGPTRNPRDPERTPGGSSSGSAAAVADGMVPLAIGTQTAGSVIRPAAFCGVVGFKPSYGLIQRAGLKTQADALDTIGVFAADVADAALFAGVLAGRPDFAAPPAASPPRIGLCRSPQWPHAQPETAAALEAAARRLSAAGATVREIELPPAFADLAAAQATIQAVEAAKSFAHERHAHWDQLSPALRRLIEQGEATPAADHMAALRLGRRCRADFPALFGDIDTLMTPSAPGMAPHGLGSTGDPAFNRIWTLLHAPCVTVPLATATPAPLGVQFVAPWGGDETLLAAAAWAESGLSAAR